MTTTTTTTGATPPRDQRRDSLAPFPSPGQARPTTAAPPGDGQAPTGAGSGARPGQTPGAGMLTDRATTDSVPPPLPARRTTPLVITEKWTLAFSTETASNRLRLSERATESCLETRMQSRTNN